MTTRLIAVFCLLAFSLTAVAVEPPIPAKIDFNRDVRPILSDNCFACHGPDAAKREALANDDLELLAVDGAANQQKSDGDAATWLPSNKVFRCQYVARHIAVKLKYELWVTQAEYDAMARVLDACPAQRLPAP